MKGLTLIELLAVLTIASILLGAGVPAMQKLFRHEEAVATTNQMLAALNWARMQAIVTARRVVLCRSGNAGGPGLPRCDKGPSGDPSHDGYEDGWVLFTDDDQDWQPNQASDVLRRFQGSGSGVTVRGQSHGNNADHIAFTHLGLSAGTTGSLVICDGYGWEAGGHWATVIVISPDGRTRTAKGDSPGLSVTSCTP